MPYTTDPGEFIREQERRGIKYYSTNKYQTFEDAGATLGDLGLVRDLFIGFQKYLYQNRIA
jgi:hypothetical protein